jgi:cobaltochelatase CobN
VQIALLSTSDTDLLSARASGADYRWGNPSRLGIDELGEIAGGSDLVVVRLLGSPQQYDDELAAVRAAGRPVVVLGGELTPSAELMEESTVPVGVAAEAHRYLAEGGPRNLAELHAFLCDTVLLTGEGFEAPEVVPAWGFLERDGWVVPDEKHPYSAPRGAFRQGLSRVARVGVLFYRAHQTSGNTAFVHALCDAIDATGEAVAVPIFAGSLRAAPDDLFEALGTLDALVVTVLAAGGSTPAAASAGEDDESWDVERIAALDIPVLQGLCLNNSRAEWEESDDGVSPMDYASQVAIPEFDGRISTAPFSFKEIDPDDSAGLPRYEPDAERCARVAGLAVNHARLRKVPNPEKRLALMLSAYPTKHSRVGNAVGLDTPVSAVRLLRRLRDEGYDLGSDNEVVRALALDDDTEAGGDQRRRLPGVDGRPACFAS